MWPLFYGVVTDFSFALINAVILFWNNISLKMYLLLTYDALKFNNYSKLEKIVKIFVCCSHFFKIISNDINIYFFDRSLRKFFKEIFAGAFNILTMQKMWEMV